jgi:hypothetical protein
MVATKHLLDFRRRNVNSQLNFWSCRVEFNIEENILLPTTTSQFRYRIVCLSVSARWIPSRLDHTDHSFIFITDRHPIIIDKWRMPSVFRSIHWLWVDLRPGDVCTCAGSGRYDSSLVYILVLICSTVLHCTRSRREIMTYASLASAL